MANGGVIVVIAMIVMAAIVTGLYFGGVFDNIGAKKTVAPAPAVPPAPAGKTKQASEKKEKGVKTEIMVQCDDYGVVKLNDKQIGTLSKGGAFSTYRTITTSTRSGDVLSFHIHNDASAGGLRCVIKRGEDYYVTGDNEDFTIPNSNTVLLADTTKYGSNVQNDIIDAVYNKDAGLKDAPVKFADAQWIWDENECVNCDVIFTVEIK